MTFRRLFGVSVLALGLGLGSPPPTLLAHQSKDVRTEVEAPASEGVAGVRQVTIREERERVTPERPVREGPSVDGAPTVVSEVEEGAVQTGAETRRTRREFITDADGRQQLVSTVDEHRVDRADGGTTIRREVTEPDANGRSREVRREREETVPGAEGVFTTRIEVSEPPVDGGGFVPTELVEQKERRDGDQVVALERTTYVDPTGRGKWEPLEQRILERDVADGRARTVESVYRSDGAGGLVESDRILGREWVGADGREHRTEEIFTTDVPGAARTAAPRLFQQVETVRTPRDNGGTSTTRTVKEQRGGRWLVVERVVERARPDGRGGTTVQRETQRLDINGRFQTVSVSEVRESVR